MTFKLEVDSSSSRLTKQVIDLRKRPWSYMKKAVIDGLIGITTKIRSIWRRQLLKF